MSVIEIPERDPATYSPVEAWLTGLPEGTDYGTAIAEFVAATPPAERDSLGYAWTSMWARPNQKLPTSDWLTLFLRAGRGFGKTRTGAEAVRKLVTDGDAGHVGIVGTTAADTRDVMIEGESGLLVAHPENTRPHYEPSKRLLTWPNGATGHIRSAEEPDSLRGLNTDLLWIDEPASWRYGKAAWDNAKLGNRIGRPRRIITGTPRPLPWLRAIEKERRTITVTGSTYDNLANLAPEFIADILGTYEGTRLGRQELHALYLEDVEGALWTLASIELHRIGALDRTGPWGSLTREIAGGRTKAGLGLWTPAKGERRRFQTIVAVDPPAETAECGIVVATGPENGSAGRDHAIVLDDLSRKGTPEEWGAAVVAAVTKWNADMVVVEANQGGDMTRSTIHAVDPNVRVEKLRAVDSKADRAEPISALYARGWVHHAGTFPKLEDQMTTWVPGESKSPDRLDAAVHAVRWLLSVKNVKRASFASPIGRRPR